MEYPVRKQIRLKGYDYNQNGVYFLTICTQKRFCCFWDGETGRLNEAGTSVVRRLKELSTRFSGLQLDCYAVMPNHVHMLLEIPPKVSISSFMGYLKGKSSLMIYEKYPELKYKYRNREFWCRGYYVDTAGKNAKKIEEYIRHQLEEDRAGEQLTMGNI